jgi:hypothetical protein
MLQLSLNLFSHRFAPSVAAGMVRGAGPDAW